MTEMNQPNVPTQGVDESVKQISLEDIKTKLAGASKAFKDRYYSIYPIYGICAYAIVDYFKNTRGGKQWADFLKSAQTVNDTKGNQYGYYQSLAEVFDLGEAYDEYDVIVKVLEVREAHGLDAFEADNTAKCIAEFKTVFLLKEDNKCYTPVTCVMSSK